MPRYNIDKPSAKEKKLTQLDQLQQMDLRQQGADATQQSGMLDMLRQLYSISADQAMQPEKLRGATLQNDALDFQNQWAQPNAMQRFESGAIQNNLGQQQADWYSTQQADAQALRQAELARQPELLRGMNLQNEAQANTNAWYNPTQEQNYLQGDAKLQMVPDMIRQLQLQNEAQTFENQWAQPFAQQKFQLMDAQANALNDKSAQLPAAYPHMPADAQAYALEQIYPGLAQQRAAKAAQKEAARQADMATYQQQQAGAGQGGQTYMQVGARAGADAFMPYLPFLRLLNQPIRRNP